MTSLTPIPDDILALLGEASADPNGLVRAVTDRNRSPDERGRRRSVLLHGLADQGLVKLHAIAGDKNNPVGERVITFRITEAGRVADAPR